MVDFNTLLGASLNLNFDYDRISNEIQSCRSRWIETPVWQNWIDMAERGDFFKVETDEMYQRISRSYKGPDGKTIDDNREFKGFYNFYLTSPEEEDQFTDRSFNRTKYINHKNWAWRNSLKDSIPYTIKCIESLPYNKIGLIRVFITENTFFPTHFDYERFRDYENTDEVDDLTKTLGISIIPRTGNVPLKIWSNLDSCVKSVDGNCMIFRDSQPHGVPYTPDMRITIRIFGEIDFSKIENLLDKNTIVQ